MPKYMLETQESYSRCHPHGCRNESLEHRLIREADVTALGARRQKSEECRAGVAQNLSLKPCLRRRAPILVGCNFIRHALYVQMTYLTPECRAERQGLHYRGDSQLMVSK